MEQTSGIADDAIRYDEKKIPVLDGKADVQKPVRTFRPKIDLGACANSYNCLIFCPHGAISRNEKGRPVIDYNICTGCLICLRECPSAAISEEREIR